MESVLPLKPLLAPACQRRKDKTLDLTPGPSCSVHSLLFLASVSTSPSQPSLPTPVVAETYWIIVYLFFISYHTCFEIALFVCLVGWALFTTTAPPPPGFKYLYRMCSPDVLCNLDIYVLYKILGLFLRRCRLYILMELFISLFLVFFYN